MGGEFGKKGALGGSGDRLPPVTAADEHDSTMAQRNELTRRIQQRGHFVRAGSGQRQAVRAPIQCKAGDGLGDEPRQQIV